MVINLAPLSLSNKKVNFYTWPRLTFLKKNATVNAHKSISETLDFKIFWTGWGEHAPRPALVVRAFGARNLPRLILKSGYGPDSDFGAITVTERSRAAPISKVESIGQAFIPYRIDILSLRLALGSKKRLKFCKHILFVYSPKKTTHTHTHTSVDG